MAGPIDKFKHWWFGGWRETWFSWFGMDSPEAAYEAMKQGAIWADDHPNLATLLRVTMIFVTVGFLAGVVACLRCMING